MDIFAEIVGWYGMVAIVSAYFLNVWGVIPADGLVSLLLNLTGALGVIVISYHRKVWQTLGLNLVWAVIAIVALVKILSFLCAGL